MFDGPSYVTVKSELPRRVLSGDENMRWVLCFGACLVQANAFSLDARWWSWSWMVGDTSAWLFGISRHRSWRLLWQGLCSWSLMVVSKCLPHGEVMMVMTPNDNLDNTFLLDGVCVCAHLCVWCLYSQVCKGALSFFGRQGALSCAGVLISFPRFTN